MKITGDSKELHNFFYNLELVAPGKGEAKKTVSSGKIFLESTNISLHGLATDDILSICGRVFVSESEESCGEYSIDDIKPIRIWLGKQQGVQTIELPDDPDPEKEVLERIELFWHSHVLDSIDSFSDVAVPLMLPRVNLSPEKLRKFSLLEPRGQHPIRFEFVEWADRDIIRWYYGPEYSGVLVILNV